MITSRDNARVKRWARLARDASLRKKDGSAIVEGAHLVNEALHAGVKLRALVVSASGAERPEIRKLARSAQPVFVSDAVFKLIAEAETPTGIAAEVQIPQPHAATLGPCVFLESIQDPSNIGAILRSAAAFGVTEVVLDRACADAWSPKALRAGMGGHFKLALRQVNRLAEALEGFGGTLVCTVPSRGIPLREAHLSGRIGWVFGAEGRGVSAALQEQADLRITIPMAAGTESLNVAAACAICLYEAFSRSAAGSSARAES